MMEGEVQIFFLIAVIISFLSGNSSCQVNHNNRTLLGPYYRYQLPVTKYSIANLKILKQFARLLFTPGVINFPVQLSKSFNFSRKYGIRLNTTFQKLIIVNISTGLKGFINRV